MYEPELQVDRVTVTADDANNVRATNTIKISNICSSTTIEQVRSFDSSVTTAQQSVIGEDILKLCTSLTSSEKGGDHGSKIIYIVQTDNEVNQYLAGNIKLNYCMFSQFCS